MKDEIEKLTDQIKTLRGSVSRLNGEIERLKNPRVTSDWCTEAIPTKTGNGRNNYRTRYTFEVIVKK